MSHRIAFLYNYPLVDNTRWKQDLFRALYGQHNMLVVFGKTHVKEYLRTYLRRRHENNIDDVTPAGPREPATRTMAVVRQLGIPVKYVCHHNSDACIRILYDFKPNFVVTALDHLLSKRVIASVPNILNVHYGVLPDVKGWNATEWSLLVTGRLSASLHRVVWPVDSGEIFATKDIEVEPTDGMGSLRDKCQSAAFQLYTEFFRDPARYEKSARSGTEGRTYYVMNRHLKREVLDGIKSGRFSRGTLVPAGG